MGKVVYINRFWTYILITSVGVRVWSGGDLEHYESHYCIDDTLENPGKISNLIFSL